MSNNNGTPVSGQESTKTLAQVVELLAHLGSPYTVAGYLEGLGIRGLRYRSEDSALARWIRWETGAVRCEIDPWEIAVIYLDHTVQVEYAPDVVADFERSFDRGEFPNLVSTEVTI